MTNASWKEKVIASLAKLEVQVQVLAADVAIIKSKAMQDERILNGRAFQVRLLAASILSSAAVSLLVAWVK